MSAGGAGAGCPAASAAPHIAPRLTKSELTTHMDDDGLRERTGGLVEATGSPAAAELADLVAHVTCRPRRVNLRQVMMPPTAQV
ncbi:hypothetical protein ABK046_18795 [Streptomyces caeruleatus]